MFYPVLSPLARQGGESMTFVVGLRIVLFGLVISLQSAHLSAGITAAQEIQPIITTAELVVGLNRFAFGLMKAGKLLEDADVNLRLYALDGGEAKLAAEIKVPYQSVKHVKQERSVHRHADGTEHVHGGGGRVRRAGPLRGAVGILTGRYLGHRTAR
jgi:hypothetical protein